MKKVRIALAVVFAASLALGMSLGGCSTGKQIQLLQAGEVAPGDGTADLPITERKGLVVLPVEIGGNSLEMLFDTGAFQSKIEAEIAARLGVVAQAEKTNSDAYGNERRQGVGILPPARLGDLVFTEVSAGILRYGADSASPCVAPHGIVGGNWIRLANWRIDFAAGRVEAFGPQAEFPVPASAVSMPFDRPALSGTPRVTLVVAGHEIDDVLLDTGYNGGLVLPASARKTLDLDTEDLTRVVDAVSSGIHGTRQHERWETTLPVGFPGTEAIETRVGFHDGSDPKVGTEVLAHFTVYVDSQARKIHLDPSEMPQAYAPRPLRHGFLPKMVEGDLWRVDYLETKPGASPRVALGDTFARINGSPPSEVFASYCEYVHGIRDFLATDALELERPDGTVLTLP